MGAPKDVRRVPSFCYNCVSGPDFLKVKVEDGVAVEIEPNFAAEHVHPGRGRPCVKAYGLVQKTYNPNRILSPMKRTNPKKGMKQDPKFVPISWDEAFEIIAARLNAIRAKGLIDESGAPRLAASFGHGGTPANYMGSFPGFLAAWGPVDYSFGSGQGVKCTHSEHLYGEFWHRGFTVAADTPHCNYVISCGANVEVTGGPTAVIRHAEARVRGYKRVHVEPHLSITASCSAEWVPIRPKTDPAFLFALIHVLTCENGTPKLDVPFLRDRTASPYLVGPDGFYLRDPDAGKPLLWDTATGRATAFDTPGVVPAVDGRYTIARAVTIGPDGARTEFADVEAPTAHQALIDQMARYTPEWAEQICDVPANTIRRIANEYLDAASIGATIEIDGVTLPLRPVAVTLGKSVNNGWGAYECCWARTVLAVLVGALENPGGLVGTTVRLNKPQDNRHNSVKPSDDGFMVQHFNPTSAEGWEHTPSTRNLHRTLVPIVGRNGGWSQALGPTQLAWLLSEKVPDDWTFPQPTYPEVWFVFRSNPAVSFWQTRLLAEQVAKFPFMVAFAYTVDETNSMADILLPDATDFESNQLIAISQTKYMEQFWRHTGVVLRAKAVEPQGEARDFSWISGELARRTGLLDNYVAQINRGIGVVTPLKGDTYDFRLDPSRVPTPDEIWDAACKAATTTLSDGKDCRGLDWFREHGFWTKPMSQLQWYLTPTLANQGLRYELPYQERLLRVGQELGNRLHEKNMHWWDEQLTEYVALPGWHDVPGRWVRALESAGCRPEDYPFWLLSTKSMQYHSGGNAGIAMMDEVAQNLHGHTGVMMNAATAAKLGIAEGDRVEVRSQIGATYGRAALMQGVRPDTIVIMGQFDHWATPYIKDQERPSLNTIAPMSIELTDATGSGADIVRVAVRRMEKAAAA